MKVLHARARFKGPDTHIITVPLNMDPTFYFNMRNTTLDGSLVPFTSDGGTAVLTIGPNQIEGVNLEDSIWQFDAMGEFITNGALWTLHGVRKGRRMLFASGTMQFLVRR